MTPEQTALARRLVAHPKWRWVEGMAATGGRRVIKVDREGRGLCMEEDYAGADEVLVYVRREVSELDLSDWATAAILMRMALKECSWDTDSSGADLFLGPAGNDHSLDIDGDVGSVAATALLACWDE